MRLGLLAALLAVALTAGLLAVAPVRDAAQAALSGDLGAVRSELDGLGTGVAALVLVALALVHVVVPYPAELPTAAAGFVLGFAAGFPLMLGAWVLSAIAAYGLALHAGRPVVARLAGERRLARAERLLRRGGAEGLLAVRLIPLVPFSLVCAVCGVTRVPFGRYLWTTAVGTAPLTALTVLLGQRLQEPSLSDPVLWAALGAIVLLVLLARPARRRLSARA